MQINVKSDLKALSKHLDRIQKKQIPFATAKALTQTAKDAQAAAKRAAVAKLDRPTPFTLRGFAIERATKRNLRARVFIKSVQAKYLKWQIEGGVKSGGRRGLRVPANIRVNKYGNIPRGRVLKLLAQANVFRGEVDGVMGIWQRYKRKAPKLLIALEPRIRYGIKFPFGRIVQGSARRRLVINFKKALADALRTARP